MKKRTKLLALLMTFFTIFTAKAEYALQVYPFQSKAGLTTDDAQCFQINLNNEAPIWGVEFAMKLPEGVSLDFDAFEMLKERFPSKRGGQFYHNLEYRTHENGWTAVVINNNGKYETKGFTGALLNVYYLTDPNLKPGLYPIQFKRTIFALNSSSMDPNTRVEIEESTSYLYVGESPIKTQKDINLSCLTNNIPSFVMDAVNADLAMNTKAQSLDLTGMTNFEKAPILSNPNALCYITANTAAATKLDAAKTANIIKKDAETYVCSQLTLNEAHPFYCTQQVSVENASLERAPIAAQWNTLCLPFDLSKEQIEATYGTGAYIQDFTSFENNCLNFNTDETGYSANQPSLLYVPQSKTDYKYNFGPVTLLPTTTSPTVTFNGATFTGNYEGNKSATGVYGVTTDSKIMIGGNNATINGFKAYFDIPKVSNSKLLNINHGDITAIRDLHTNLEYGDIYTLDGKLLIRNVNKKEMMNCLPKGTYIINNQKVFVK